MSQILTPNRYLMGFEEFHDLGSLFILLISDSAVEIRYEKRVALLFPFI
jgi:hypothetical protein